MREEKIPMFQWLPKSRAKIALFALLVSFAPGWCFAQEAAPPSSQRLSAAQRAAILQELDAMKKRIDALEAELNSGSQPAPVSKAAELIPATAHPAAASEAPLLVSSRESSSLGSVAPAQVFPEVAGQNIPASEPLALADFTWMNANPREKDTPLDTKLFTPEFRDVISYLFDFYQPKDD